MIRSKLFTKMVVTYFCILISTLTMLGVLLSFLLNNYLIYNKQMEMLVKATNISTLVKPYLVEKRDPGELVSLLNLADKKLGTEIWVIDRSGGVIAASADLKYHEGDLVTPADITDLQEGRVSIRQGKSPVYNETVLWVIVPVQPENSTVIGGIIMYSPIMGITQTMAKVRNLFIYSAIVSTIFSTIVVYFLSKYVTGPLQEINRIAKQLACGKLTQRVKIKQDDEIGDLAVSFNDMADQIEKQEKMRRDFVADVSHELRSPLTNIQGFIEALMDGKDKTLEDRARYLGILHMETLRLTRLVNELLDLSKLEAGRQPLDRRPVDILDVINSSLSKAEPAAQDKNVSLALEISGGQGRQQPMVLATHDRLEQVMTNLLDNAVRYSPAGSSVTVTVAVTEPNDTVDVTVADHGKGIPPEEIPLIWERFYKVDKARSRDTGGTGLGLAIVRKIIESLGGQVRVTSEAGKGTAIGFSLPVYKPE